MIEPKAPQNPQFMTALAFLVARHQLTEAQAAGLMGVPVYTLRKWSNGTRAPNAAAVRLLEVLDMLNAFAPALLAGLIPAPTSKAKP
jgi:DNA-binding transcriptional regulator YiaG